MSGLPAGALEALLTGGKEAFDQVVADDRAATQKAMNTSPPTVAKNKYNEKAAVKEAPTTTTEKSLTTTQKDVPESETVVELPLDLADTPIESLRALAGTTQPALPSQYAEMWDQDLEHGFLQFGIHRQLPSTVLQSILDFYAETSIVSAGQTRQWAIEAFHRKFSGEVPREIRNLLIEFWTKDILGGSDTTDEGGEAR